jgi:YD repeat-containing protein
LQLTRDPLGGTQKIKHNAAGQTVEVARVDAQGRLEETVTLVWDGPHKVAESVADARGQIQHQSRYQLDHHGQLIEQTSEITTSTGVVRLHQTIRRDPHGRILNKSFGDATRIAYRYAANAEFGSRFVQLEQIHWPIWMDWVMVRLPEALQPKTVLARTGGDEFESRVAAASARTAAAETSPVRPEAEAGLAPSEAPEVFDPRGLPRTVETVKGRFNLNWNSTGQLTTVSANSDSATVARYTYDAQGRRASKTTDAFGEHYLYEGTQLISVLRRDRSLPVAPAVVSRASHKHFFYAGFNQGDNQDNNRDDPI